MIAARWLVLFSRYLPDDVEILPANPSTADKWAQLARELGEADATLAPVTVAAIKAGWEWDVFAVTVVHDGDRASLVSRLQTAYDAYGVGGFFETGERVA